MSRKITNEDFVRMAKEVHGDKYDYSKTEYKLMRAKVKIICPVHGEFEQDARHHIDGCGCPKCSHKSYKFTHDEFMEMARKIHGNKYEYLSEYKRRNDKIQIKCPIHGVFEQEPRSHLNGAGCPKCADLIRSEKRKMGWDIFLEKARKIHGDRYEYDLGGEYINNEMKIPIICKEHGVFYQTINKHLLGCGCPICSNSKLENEICLNLIKNKISFIPQHNIEINKKQKIDFFLPNYNAAIECQGRQHFEPIDFFGGEKEFEQRKRLDEIKLKFCNDNGIKMYYYSSIPIDIFLGEKVYHSPEELINKIKEKQSCEKQVY